MKLKTLSIVPVAVVAMMAAGTTVVQADTGHNSVRPAATNTLLPVNVGAAGSFAVLWVLRHECGSPHRSERGFLVVRQGFWAGAGGPVSCTRLATGFRGSEKMRPMRIKRPCG